MARLCMFPGQGAQCKGMGEGLFTQFPHLVEASSDLLGYDVEQLCLNASAEDLSKTQITQPLLYVVNALSYLKHVEETGVVPDYLAGHSLGEYSALFAAGCFDFFTGLELVKERGRLMSAVTGGSMYAIIGIPSEDAVAVLAANGHDELTIANYNSYLQTVIGGYSDDDEALKESFLKAGAAAVVKLNVSACFHTLHMRDAADQYHRFLTKYRFSSPKIPVIANVTGLPYQPNDDIPSMLVKQIYSPVLWLQSMQYLLPMIDDQWAEVGPGRVLSNLMLQISEKDKTLR